MNTQAPQTQLIQTQQKEEDEVHLKDYLSMFKRRWQWILLSFIVAMGLTVVYLSITPNQYEATAVIKIPVSSSGGIASAIGAFLPVRPTSDISTEVETIKGRDIAETVIKELKLDKKEENSKLERGQIILKFQKMLKVGQKNRTNLVDVTAIGDSPREAKDIADQVAVEYIRISEASSKKTWDSMISQMAAKIKETEDVLERSRQLLHKYEAKEGITTAFSSLLVGGGESKGGYGTQYAVPENLQAVVALKANIMQMEIQLEGLRKYLPEGNPEVVRLKTNILDSKQRLQQEEKKAIEKYNKLFGLSNLAAKVVFNQQMYAQLVTKHEELKAEYIMQNKIPEIAESALEPIYPTKPKKMLSLMLGGMMGLFLGLGFAFLKEYLDNSIHTLDDVAKTMDLTVIGRIPYLRGAKGNPAVNGSSLLITYNDAQSSEKTWVREFYRKSYRMLQLELMSVFMASADSENVIPERSDGSKNSCGRVLLVTSSVPGEGKSVVATNLAVSMAQTEKRVLLVEANCLNSSLRFLSGLETRTSDTILQQAEELNLDVRKGLIDVLEGKSEWNNVVRKTSVCNLYVITSGSESGQSDLSALLISSRFDDLIKSLKEQFDVIIFDSPPVTLSSEPVSIGLKADGVILVVKMYHTNKDAIFQAKCMLQNSGANVLGIVLN
ncbi:MAG: Polysaccharide biosynthesis tyrosine autokinase, partial [Candidatus Poribacteria bacterium]|nr:Polysaccharide biosynthesis tyrosine autokinase [Candidatus Poribacteria bacterium]